jgi:hypothetical protein
MGSGSRALLLATAARWVRNYKKAANKLLSFKTNMCGGAQENTGELAVPGKKSLQLVDVPGHGRIRDTILDKYAGKSIVPDPLVRGTDRRIRIRTKMSRITNIVAKKSKGVVKKRSSFISSFRQYCGSVIISYGS